MRKRAVRPDAIFDPDAAVLVFPEGRVNHPALSANVSMNDRRIFLLHTACFPDSSQFASCCLPFGDQHDPAGLPVEPVDQLRPGAMTPGAASSLSRAVEKLPLLGAVRGGFCATACHDRPAQVKPHAADQAG